MSKEGGGVQVLQVLWGRGSGIVWRSLYLFLKKPITLLIVRGCQDLLTPTSLWINHSEIKKPVEKIDAPQIYG